MTKAGATFWLDVQRGTPPEIETYFPGDRDDLATAYPEPEPGTVVELGDEGAELVEELRALKDVHKRNAERIEATENALKAAIGEREIATVDGDPVITWKAVTSRRVDLSRLKAEAPDVAERFTAPTTSRRFLVR